MNDQEFQINWLNDFIEQKDEVLSEYSKMKRKIANELLEKSVRITHELTLNFIKKYYN